MPAACRSRPGIDSQAPTALLAAAALALTGATGCWGCATAPSRSPDFTVRSAGAKDLPDAPDLAAPKLRVLHTADFGDPTPQQAKVARALVAAHREAPFALAFFAGDNVYECGPELGPGPSGCAFAEDGSTLARAPATIRPGTFARHEAPLDALAEPPAPEVFLALGNHDVWTTGRCRRRGDPARQAREKACLSVAHRSPLWRMPGRHYAVDRGPARFLVLDTNLVAGSYGGFTLEEEVAFLRAEARACRPDACDREAGGCEKPLCFVVGHHPPASAGTHASDLGPRYRARMQRLLDAGDGRIRAWLVGHDHDLQHLRTGGGLDVLVSGNAARGRPRERFAHVSPDDARLLFATVRWGYGVLEVAADGWRYAFHADDGAPLHCCAARGPGRCEPIACP
jgi:hypothetical protein